MVQSEMDTELPTKKPPAVAALVLALLGVVAFGLLLGLPAWIVSARQLRKIKAGTVSSRYRGLFRASLVLGIVGTFVTTFFTVDVFLYFLVDILF